MLASEQQQPPATASATAADAPTPAGPMRQGQGQGAPIALPPMRPKLPNLGGDSTNAMLAGSRATAPPVLPSIKAYKER